MEITMKLIRTEDAVGQVLCHDITQIIPGVVKEPCSVRDILSRKRIFPYCYLWVRNISMCGKKRKVSCMRTRQR